MGWSRGCAQFLSVGPFWRSGVIILAPIAHVLLDPEIHLIRNLAPRLQQFVRNTERNRDNGRSSPGAIVAQHITGGLAECLQRLSVEIKTSLSVMG